MAIEIVDFPIRNGGSFQFAMLNYQRVYRMLYPLNIALDFLVSYIKIPWIFSAYYCGGHESKQRRVHALVDTQPVALHGTVERTEDSPSVDHLQSYTPRAFGMLRGRSKDHMDHGSHGLQGSRKLKGFTQDGMIDLYVM